VCCDVRPALRDLGMFAIAPERSAVCRRQLYHRRVLVHRFDVVCESAVTVARALSDTFAGIRPADAPYFILAQIVGAVAATVLFRWLVPSLPAAAKNVVARETERVG